MGSSEPFGVTRLPLFRFTGEQHGHKKVQDMPQSDSVRQQHTLCKWCRKSDREYAARRRAKMLERTGGLYSGNAPEWRVRLREVAKEESQMAKVA